MFKKVIYEDFVNNPNLYLHDTMSLQITEVPQGKFFLQKILKKLANMPKIRELAQVSKVTNSVCDFDYLINRFREKKELFFGSLQIRIQQEAKITKEPDVSINTVHATNVDTATKILELAPSLKEKAIDHQNLNHAFNCYMIFLFGILHRFDNDLRDLDLRFENGRYIASFKYQMDIYQIEISHKLYEFKKNGDSINLSVSQGKGIVNPHSAVYEFEEWLK